ncbi:molybdate ABC transporter substrate-binding protein [Zavarzinia compransoris]|uniref:Molybdate ABC transporter substrate-binding protein n=1 Tax=Zavarzinia compransoris TaxID=1264899 RepID=A0A317DWG0_9PROT|nr:molybdate ABC transporter substrate-binding protein [Zavarzinia compransoris]PWR19029.1 molybdate ABC transporter substrate-binding protein [Zavarzinia compransoris]TDP49036.1 molybdate transport system substrate-binding protein [Zavarzinia compransoris]
MTLTRRLLLSLAAAAVLSLPMVHKAKAEDKPVLVFAAASLKESLGKVAESYKAETGKTVTLSFAASGPLAKQIEAAAPADVFISADLKWMSYLSDKGLTDKATEKALLGNTLVLIAPKDSATTTVPLAEGFDLAGLLGDGRLAIGEVTSVPAGTYGKTALESLKLFDSVKDKLAQGESVRAALALVSRGEAPLGIVYATDAAADPSVKVVATFPAASYPAIVYPVARVAASTNADAAGFIAYLQAPAATATFEAAGFTVPK